MARQTMLRKLFNKKDVLVYVVNCFLNLNFKPVSTDFCFYGNEYKRSANKMETGLKKFNQFSMINLELH